MDFLQLLSSEIQDYIINNSSINISKLALQKNPFPEVDFKKVLNQIEARKKSELKLPTWFSTKNILFPSKISVEQTSSEITAKYKAELISGESLIDLTGGFGVDDYYFSKQFKEIIHCELNTELSQIVNHNYKQFEVNNITCECGDSSEILKKLNQKFDWIYIDPSRRNDLKGKVFMLNDCMPNIPKLLDFYFNYSNNILIKTAPILDISAGLNELKNVKIIHIVAIDNEVKELLWEIENNYSGMISIKTINLLKDKSQIFNFQYDSSNTPEYSLPKKYLYESNSSIMKSGGFNEVSNHFNLTKLHKHSHLYTNDYLIDFPGRVFIINKIILYAKLEMKNELENKKANITIRNFPDSVEKIRKKWKINDGGDQYCFFTTNLNNDKIVLICSKINS